MYHWHTAEWVEAVGFWAYVEFLVEFSLNVVKCSYGHFAVFETSYVRIVKPKKTKAVYVNKTNFFPYSVTLLNTSFLNFLKTQLKQGKLFSMIQTASQNHLTFAPHIFDHVLLNAQMKVFCMSNQAFLSEQEFRRTLVILSSQTSLLLPPGIPTTHQHETQVAGAGRE